MRFTDDAQEAWELYQDKEVDFVSQLPQEELENHKDALVFQPETDCILFNQEAEPLNDIQVRQALALAIDHSALAEILKTGTTAASGLVPARYRPGGGRGFPYHCWLHCWIWRAPRSGGGSDPGEGSPASGWL